MNNLYASVEIKRLKQNLTDTINNSPLSFCIKQLVVSEALSAICTAADQEYEKDLADMKKAKQEQDKQEA